MFRGEKKSGLQNKSNVQFNFEVHVEIYMEFLRSEQKVNFQNVGITRAIECGKGLFVLTCVHFH